ncbi:hypothetical protein BESB_035780 [Besnoitia besnoiti]|uniref:Uncharacterized protein n=1 Tax=Besnoitia besnoiti TaxID=94643 RepID=A0A2A9MN85_BESBE|nr:hypothetical protein BESB_035780 [Besnoitia besnoiti]PFH37120.1 hypothetical protein BESB_035780 [Besnoitia besnoiti]
MAKLLEHIHRLSFWLVGGTHTEPPAIPIPSKFRPLAEEVVLFLNLRGKLPSDWTRAQIMSYVDDSVSDRELQAHVMAHLRDTAGVHFDSKLNPSAPQPMYLGQMTMATTWGTETTTSAVGDAEADL